MVAYLANGWFTQVGPRRLRAEVVDGALDSAALLHQSGVRLELLFAVLLRLRTLTFLLGRDRAKGNDSFGAPEREALRHHVQEATDADFTLQALLLDCLDHVGDVSALRALLLHVMHIGHVCRLLTLAVAQQPMATLHAGVSAPAPLGEAPAPRATSWQMPR